MFNKFKKTALKDLSTTALVLYCSGWIILILYVIMDSVFNNTNYGVNGRYNAEQLSDPSRIFEEIMMFGIIIFPLMALMGLISIKISVNRLEKQISKTYAK